MSFRSTVLPAAAIATVLVLAATGAAFAQAAGGGRGGGSASGPGAEPDQTKMIVYGTPGNCPPTMAGCGAVLKPKPIIGKSRYDPCGDLDLGSAAYRECRRKR